MTLEAADWLRDPAGGGALDHRGAPAGGLLPGPGCGAAPPRCHGHGLSSQVRISRAQDTEIFQPYREYFTGANMLLLAAMGVAAAAQVTIGVKVR